MRTTSRLGQLAPLLALLQQAQAVPKSHGSKGSQGSQGGSQSGAPQGQGQDWVGLPYTWQYSTALPIPPLKEVTQTVSTGNGSTIDYYELDIKPFSHQIYPGQAATPLVGYDGLPVGPTILVNKGQETVLRFSNHGEGNAVVHLHGSPSHPPWDGWAEDYVGVGEYKDYYYPNYESARTMWYHDHTDMETAVNVNRGQAGLYIVQDENEDVLGLPSGYGTYDVPLVLASKYYNSDASLLSPAGERVSYFGDVIHVNGQPWPYMNVEARKYRFRLLNSAVSRAFLLSLTRDADNAAAPQAFQVIASDSGLLSAPAPTTELSLAMAERWDIVVDFSQYAGQNLTLRNADNVAEAVDYAQTGEVMRFVVAAGAVEDDSAVPAQLRDIPALPAHSGKPDRMFNFFHNGKEWVINGVGFDDVAHRVLARPPQGTVEVWQLSNLAREHASHPVHIHLIDFKILSRTGGSGRGLSNYEATGLKDVVYLEPGEVATVEARYGPWAGLYMFHCHNLIHEDHAMMAAMNVTELENLGYQDTSLVDPLDPRFQAVAIDESAFTSQAVEQAVQALGALNAYDNPAF